MNVDVKSYLHGSLSCCTHKHSPGIRTQNPTDVCNKGIYCKIDERTDWHVAGVIRGLPTDLLEHLLPLLSPENHEYISLLWHIALLCVFSSTKSWFCFFNGIYLAWTVDMTKKAVQMVNIKLSKISKASWFGLENLLVKKEYQKMTTTTLFRFLYQNLWTCFHQY